TGTTVLQNMLEQAPHRRALQFWETTSPIPWHDDLEKDRAARIKRSDNDLKLAYRVVPEMAEVHEVKSTTAEECWPLLSNTFAVVNFDICHGLKPYGEWLMDFDMEWAYREYRRMLQILLWRIPAKQLVLKCPEHLWKLDALLKVFPDACVVWTHREPFDCVASYSSMISLSRRTLQGRIDPSVIGPHIADRFQRGVTRAMAARDALGDEDRFFDVDFKTLIGDRVGMVNRIEQHFGLELTDPALLQGWLDQKRADGRGKHRYDPAMWGVEEGRINEQFRVYMERFGLGD
ncbi:MAG: sulfotransferase, partial [Deltaproteobacteria bacterium]|nr:sulfotransferase [Deltaproteobacteria bacterium]